ncbi:MAG TPA: type IX secretion system outer membrane channel protein PorV [Panacibacter sp.]|nr:type IX secretion system outer membrane channel protein PorV [Panacibacter sp.]HNP44473.1 type IX secretion system outer membrane channel protein PorV [Panacibacter sp.]
MKWINVKSTTITFLLLTAACSALKAQETAPINIVTTAVPFLRISPDARGGGMGDVGVATAPDANSNFWNLAKTPFAKSRGGLAATYTPWLKDIAQDVYLTTLGGYYQLDGESAISGGLRYFNLGQIQFVDFAGNPLSTSNPREFALDFGYSRKISDNLSVGVALRYINSNLANGLSVNGVTYKAGQTVAADLSLFHNGLNEDGEGLTYGISITNLGGKIGYTNDAQSKDFIPANMGLGLGYTWVFDETSKFTLALDVNKLLVPSAPVPTDPEDPVKDSANLADYRNMSVFESWFKSFGNKAVTISGGGEYTYNDQFSLRAGYFYEGKEQGGRRYFTAGVGLKYNQFGFNFSYLAPSGQGVTRNPLSNTLRLGLTIDLGGSGEDSAF